MLFYGVLGADGGGWHTLRDEQRSEPGPRGRVGKGKSKYLRYLRYLELDVYTP